MQAIPAIDLSAIPAAQRAAVLALMETVAALTEITRRQEHLIAELNRALHGKRSEKLSEDERQLAFEDLSIALAEVEAEKETCAAKADNGTTRPAPKRTIGNLPAALPRIEEIIEPASLTCPCGCGVMHKIGEDRSERLDIVPAQLRVIVTVRPKYACRTCTDGVTQAPAPGHLIMGGLPTEATIAHVLVSKYADHLPLYRQSQILARAGLDLHRAVLADWVGKAAFHLKPIVGRMAEHLKRSSKLFMDETTPPVLDQGRGLTKIGYLWALARDDRAWVGEDPPGRRLLLFPRSRGRECRNLPHRLCWHPADRRLHRLQSADQTFPQGRRTLSGGAVLGACTAQAQGNLRPRRLRDCRRRPAPHRRVLCRRGRYPWHLARPTSVRPPGPHRAPGGRLR